MISGAQTQVPAVAISGPNNVLSRLTFHPQVEVDDLDKFNFNVVPDKDPVPRLDQLSKHYKKINCRAKLNELKNNCHNWKSSLCELLHTCGSSNRPIPCDCVNRFGYEEPESINGMKFSEACPID